MWPTMSGFAKFTRTKSYLPPSIARRPPRRRRRRRAHLGLQVVGRDVVRRGEHLAVLAVEGLLAAAVEEVRHVRVLLGLGAAELLQPGARDDLGEDVRERLLREGDGEAEGRRRTSSCTRSGLRTARCRRAGEARRSRAIARARVSSRARSGRKLKWSAASLRGVDALRSRRRRTGSTNSSVFPRRSSRRAPPSAVAACGASASHNRAVRACSTRSQRLSRSMAQ